MIITSLALFIFLLAFFPKLEKIQKKIKEKIKRSDGFDGSHILYIEIE